MARKSKKKATKKKLSKKGSRKKKAKKKVVKKNTATKKKVAKKKAKKKVARKKTKKKITKKKANKKATKKKAKKKIAPKKKTSTRPAKLKKPKVPSLEEITQNAKSGFKAPFVNPFITKDPRDAKPDKFEDATVLGDTVDINTLHLNDDDEDIFEEESMEAEESLLNPLDNFEDMDDDGGYF